MIVLSLPIQPLACLGPKGVMEAASCRPKEHLHAVSLRQIILMRPRYTHQIRLFDVRDEWGKCTWGAEEKEVVAK